MLSKYFDPHVGGVERHVKEVSRILIKRSIKVCLFTEKHEDSLADYENINGIKVYRFKCLRIKYLGLIKIWIELFKKRKLILDSDIVHCHDVFIWYFPFRLLFPKKPVYVTFHGYEKYPILFKDFLYKRCAEKLTQGALCIGEFIKKYNMLKTNNILYGAVNTKIFKPFFGRVVYDSIYWGRVGENTDIESYLKVVSLLNKANRFKFLVLGDLNKTHRNCYSIIYKKTVRDPENYIIKARYVFAGGYLSILEAFACKKPVFAVFNNRLRRDYYFLSPFKDYIVYEGSPKKLVNKLKYYSKNPKELKLKVDKAYEWVIEQSWEKMTNNYLKMWGVN